MNDLSLHLLDIAENSIRAGATEVTLGITEAVRDNWLILTVQDNGKGMSETMQKAVTNPFVTSRTLRKVGLGLPLLAQRCELCEGELVVKSREGIGTLVTAKMRYDHIDRVPLGDVGSTMMTLIMAQPQIHYIYIHHYNEKNFICDTAILQKLLGEEVNLADVQILLWIKAYINNQIKILCEKND